MATKFEPSKKEEATSQALHNKSLMLKKAVGVLFKPINPAAKQSKAIANYRVKKLKKVLASQTQLMRAIKEGVLLSPRVLRYSGESNPKLGGRSVHARSRARESNGKFANLDKYNSLSQTTTTADFFDRSNKTPSRIGHLSDLEESCLIESFFNCSQYTPGSTRVSTVDMICEDIPSSNLPLAKLPQEGAGSMDSPLQKEILEVSLLPRLSEDEDNRDWELKSQDGHLSHNNRYVWNTEIPATGWEHLQEYLNEMEPADMLSLFSEV